MPKLNKNKSHFTKTPKTQIMKGIGKYSNGKKKTNRIKGRGGFFEDAGSRVGSFLGKKAGGLLSEIFGVGSYSVTRNTLTAQASDPPVLSNTKGATRVQHREYIQDVSGSTAFAIQSFPINPGLNTTFPWLASVANCFEQYILHGILFEFKSTSATALNSTNTALGTVILATEYNALHSNFANKREMENYVYSTSCSPDTSALHPIECARDVNVLTELYVRNIPPVLASDLRFSDLGRFQIATVGMQAAAVIGELWVTYDIELIKPKLPDAISSTPVAHYRYNAAVGIPSTGSTAPTAANLFGTAGNKVALTGNGLTPVSLDTNTITFLNSGRYIVFSVWQITSAGVNTAFTVTQTATAAGVNILGNDAGNTYAIDSPDSGTNNRFICSWYTADVTTGLTVAPQWVFSAGVFASAVKSYDLFVVPLPQGFLSPATDSYTVMDMIQQLKASVLELQGNSEDYKFVGPSQPRVIDPPLTSYPSIQDYSQKEIRSPSGFWNRKV